MVKAAQLPSHDNRWRKTLISAFRSAIFLLTFSSSFSSILIQQQQQQRSEMHVQMLAVCLALCLGRVAVRRPVKALPACSQSLLQLPVVHVVKHVVVCRVGSISLHHANKNKNKNMAMCQWALTHSYSSTRTYKEECIEGTGPAKA